MVEFKNISKEEELVELKKMRAIETLSKCNKCQKTGCSLVNGTIFSKGLKGVYCIDCQKEIEKENIIGKLVLMEVTCNGCKKKIGQEYRYYSIETMDKLTLEQNYCDNCKDNVKMLDYKKEDVLVKKGMFNCEICGKPIVNGQQGFAVKLGKFKKEEMGGFGFTPTQTSTLWYMHFYCFDGLTKGDKE